MIIDFETRAPGDLSDPYTDPPLFLVCYCPDATRLPYAGGVTWTLVGDDVWYSRITP